jgi:hypothetical protein
MVPLCQHKTIVPIVYGYMTKDIINLIAQNKILYGGVREGIEGAKLYCLECLEELDKDHNLIVR